MLPVALVGVLLVVSVWWDGAFDLRYWTPLTILSLGILLALAVAGALSLPRRGPLALSLLAFWALGGFVLLSAAWADSPFAAWTEGARTIFYASIWTITVASGARSEWRARLGAALCAGLSVVAVVVLVDLLAGGASSFLAGRLDSPIGYRNATAALFAFAAWPLIGYAAHRGTPSAARGGAFAAAVLALGLAFLTQSRGVLIGLVVGGIVSLAIGQDRLRRAWLAIGAVVAIAAVSGSLLTPYDAFTDGTLVVGAGDIRHAAQALLGIVAVALVAGLFFAIYDNGLRSATFDRRWRVVAGVALAVVAVGVAGVGLAKVGNPVDYADSKLKEFNETEPSAGSGSSTRLGTVGGQRSDLWRVAWGEFKENPVAGAGAGSYQFAYYRNRHTDRNLNDAHSLPLRLLADTGLIGLGFFGLWVFAVGWALVRRTRETTGAERMWVAGLAAAGATILAQCLTDWLWLLPGLLGLSILALGLAAGGEDPEEEPLPLSRWSPARIAVVGGVAASLVSVTFLFLGDYYTRKAQVEAFTSPPAELSAARTAASLNPVSVTPLYLEASALESEGRRAETKQKLEDALELEPDNFVTLGLLGDFEIRDGNDAAARRYYAEALALNPRDSGLKLLSEGRFKGAG